MLEWSYPWVFLLLPAPLLIGWILPAYRSPRDSVRAPFFDRLVQLSRQEPGPGSVVLQRKVVQRVMLVVAWIAILAAVAKPEWVGPPVEHTESARDLMIAVDLSGSMETEDFTTSEGEKINRLAAVKEVLQGFADRRLNDRLGLIVFGSAPYLQVPFTNDHEIWLQLLGETEISMAGYGTKFGDAIGFATKLFENSEVERRVLIVLTDGNDSGSRIPPVDAAKLAGEKGITIYSLAVGDPQASGDAALDFETLDRIAELTGGGTFQAQNRVSLEAAYARIEELEPETFETLSYRPRRSLHHVPLALFILAYPTVFFFSIRRSWNLRPKEAAHA